MICFFGAQSFLRVGMSQTGRIKSMTPRFPCHYRTGPARLGWATATARHAAVSLDHDTLTVPNFANCEAGGLHCFFIM
mgnify:FL=1